MKKKRYTIAGPICESSDVLAKNINLANQKIGDYLAIVDTGAYGFVMSSNYNSRNLPAEILVYKEKYFVIRNNENISTVIAKDMIPDWLKTS